MVLVVESLLFLTLLARCLQAASVEADEGAITNMNNGIDNFWIAQPLVPGTDPLTGHRSQPLDLSPRACLSNGTNYCFGNNVNYCSGCGVCCQGTAETKWCCSSDSICCGNQCCAKGQQCSNARCYLPVVSKTITSTFFITASHKFTQVATVFEDVVQTSTVNSIVDVTVSSLATQTDVLWVTTTISNAKRALPSQGAAALRDLSIVKRNNPGTFDLAHVIGWLLKSFHRRPRYIIDSRSEADGHPLKRQETEQALSATASTTTIYNYITQTADKTSIVSSTTTRSATSTILTTLYQTATRVLDAQTTVSVTSTLTVRPAKPTTITKTEFASPLTDSPATSQPSTSPTRTPGLVIPTSKPSDDSGLSTPAIAGIAAGAAVVALLIIGAAFLACLRRRRRRRAAAAAIAEDVDAYYDIAPHPPAAAAPMMMLRREPKMPPVSIFAPADPRHHGEAFNHHTMAVSPDLGEQQRANSSHTAGTTLVGSAGSPVQGGGAKSARTSSVGTGLSPPVEVAGTDVPPRYEIEGSSPPLGTGNGNGRSRGDGGYFAINF